MKARAEQAVARHGLSNGRSSWDGAASGTSSSPCSCSSSCTGGTTRRCGRRPRWPPWRRWRPVATWPAPTPTGSPAPTGSCAPSSTACSSSRTGRCTPCPPDAGHRTHLARVLGYRDGPGATALARFETELARQQGDGPVDPRAAVLPAAAGGVHDAASRPAVQRRASRRRLGRQVGAGRGQVRTGAGQAVRSAGSGGSPDWGRDAAEQPASAKASPSGERLRLLRRPAHPRRRHRTDPGLFPDLAAHAGDGAPAARLALRVPRTRTSGCWACAGWPRGRTAGRSSTPCSASPRRRPGSLCLLLGTSPLFAGGYVRHPDQLAFWTKAPLPRPRGRTWNARALENIAGGHYRNGGAACPASTGRAAAGAGPRRPRAGGRGRHRALPDPAGRVRAGGGPGPSPAVAGRAGPPALPAAMCPASWWRWAGSEGPSWPTQATSTC